MHCSVRKKVPPLLHSICIQCVGVWRMCKYDGTERDEMKQNRTERNDQTKDIVSHQHGLLISRMSCGAVRWPTNPQEFLCTKKRDKMYWGAMNSVQEKSGRANCMGHKCQSRVDKRPSTNLKLSWPPISLPLVSSNLPLRVTLRSGCPPKYIHIQVPLVES